MRKSKLKMWEWIGLAVTEGIGISVMSWAGYVAIKNKLRLKKDKEVMGDLRRKINWY
jgi:hypothetical protein